MVSKLLEHDGIEEQHFSQFELSVRFIIGLLEAPIPIFDGS